MPFWSLSVTHLCLIFFLADGYMCICVLIWTRVSGPSRREQFMNRSKEHLQEGVD